MLFTCAADDPRIPCSQPAKMAARLRAVKTDGRPVLLKADLSGAGHFGASGQLDKRSSTAFEYAFLLKAFGISR